jgi:hypothetical protein
MGVFGSKVTNPNWKYEYKTGAKNNDNNHSVATTTLPPIITTATTTTKEDTKQSVLTLTTNDSMPKEAKEVVVAKAEPITTAAVAVASGSGGMVVDKKSVSPVAVVAKTKPMTLPPPPPVAIKPPPVVPEQGKASIPSKEILQSTEIAKVEVQKVGVAETKERMSTKSSGTLSSSSSLPPPLEEDLSSLTEVGIVGVPKRSRGKKTVKGLSLLVAAGVVALARNVVKAYLGKGML